MAVDGFMLDVPDSEENSVEFGRRNSGTRDGAFPQVRVLVLAECGSHAVVGASMGPCKTDERALARGFLSRLEEGMLVTADRNFYSFDLWAEFRDSGADLLWRVNSNLQLPVVEWLPDGSFLSIACDPDIKGRKRDDLVGRVRDGCSVDPDEGHLVRVVEYDVPDRVGSASGEIICLVTSVLDPVEATAEELAAAYHERWECETLIDEIKTHQRGPARVLRSRSPDMVRQEIWALLLTHYGIRNLMCRAADEIGEDPDRLSFMRTLRIIRRHITAQADFSP
ncbi:hypothetical protein Acsp05_74300 [Actinokineospora sp. NBRC 105648]|nr:hypothetical protein Acsp05_74300 [Actinokineospora sp. NBRC 105648]